MPASQAVTAPDGDVVAVLPGCGYRSREAEDGIQLRNCPFHRLARDHRDLVCGLDLRLITGMIEASAHAKANAVLPPGRGAVAL